jgi:hypothetical protein
LTADFETASKSLGIPNARHLKMQTEFFAHLHQIDALAGENLGLAVQRQMVIFEHNRADCDPWCLFLAARHASPPTEFYRFYFTVRIHQLFFSYFIYKI